MLYYRGLRFTTLTRTPVDTAQVLSTPFGKHLSTSEVAHTSTPTARGQVEVRFYRKNMSVPGFLFEVG